MQGKKWFLAMSGLCLFVVLTLLPILSSCSSSASTSTSSVATSATSPASTASTPAGKVTTIKGSSLFPTEDYGYITANNSLIPLINQKLQGTGYQLELFAPDMLVPSGEQFDALSKGSVGFTLNDFSFDSQFMPETLVAFALPYAWQTLDQDLEWWDKFGGVQFYTDTYSKNNIHFTYPLPEARNVLMTKKEIKAVSDLKGLKIWSSPPHDAFIAATGAEATTVPPPEIFMGLQLGTLDGVTYTEPELKTLNFYQVVKYVYHPGIQEVLNVNFNFNLDLWKSLPANVQNVIDSTIKDQARGFYQAYAAAGDIGVNFFKANGGTVIDLAPDLSAQFKQLGRGTWDNVAKSSDRAAQAVKMLRDQMTADNIQ